MTTPNTHAEPAQPVAYIPTDALDKLKPPLLILRNVPLTTYHGEGTVPLYTHPAPAAPAITQPAEPATQQAEIDRLRSDLLMLQDFTDSVIGKFPEHGDVDGFALQEIAEACGLLKKQTVMCPCGENCACAEYLSVNAKEIECYRVQPVMRRAIKASAHARAALSQKDKP